MQSQFPVKNGVLFHLEPDKTLRVVLPCSSRKPLFDTLHSGKLTSEKLNFTMRLVITTGGLRCEVTSPSGVKRVLLCYVWTGKSSQVISDANHSSRTI